MSLGIGISFDNHDGDDHVLVVEDNVDDGGDADDHDNDDQHSVPKTMWCRYDECRDDEPIKQV